MARSLTVVLPVRNAEASLRGHVDDVLHLASELTPSFSVLIVDDGSTDDTYDLAVELATRYPQLRVLRNSRQRGLGPTLRSVRTLIKSDVVVVHDGASKVDVEEIRSLWFDPHHRTPNLKGSGMNSDVSLDDLRIAAAGHAAMAAAHSRLLGFQLMTTATATQGQDLTRREATRQQNVGTIPPLPRPNFLGSLANFALGE